MRTLDVGFQYHLSLRVSPERHVKLQAWAKELGVGANTLLETVIAAAIDLHQPRDPEVIDVDEAPPNGGSTDASSRLQAQPRGLRQGP